jgi:hypothetical protein
VVIVQLIGGLGNQLFQYAAGRAIAHRRNVPLKLDISKYQNYPLRKYALNDFNVAASIAQSSEVAHVTGSDRNPVYRRVSSRIQDWLPYYRRSVLVQQHRHFDPRVLKASRDVYLVGYWQSEKYFRGIEGVIRKELTLRETPDPVNEAMGRRINETASVSLHIRRGDYVSSLETARHHGLCSLEYYYAAVETLTRMVNQPHFFVFSDDVSWAERNLRLNFSVTYVKHNGKERDSEDLRLMTQCKHHILANSTFSWWAAWLCESPTKIVIAPRKWFESGNCDTRDLIPASWIQI